MTFPKTLDVVGSRSIFRLFLPGSGGPFEFPTFKEVTPSGAQENFAMIGQEESLTVVVNPDDYSLEDVSSIQGPVWLWFLRRMVTGQFQPSSSEPKFSALAREELEVRERYLEGLLLRAPVSHRFVVSDSSTRDYLAARGRPTAVSPPPVNLSAVVPKDTQGLSPRIVVFTPGTPYSNLFTEPLSGGLEQLGLHAVNWNEVFSRSTHVVNVGDSLLASFPYPIAVSLVAGKTLISTALNPLWGLEPGIDFIEVSRPEELARVCESISRNPNLTRLMARRASQKSFVFDSSRIFQKLQSVLG